MSKSKTDAICEKLLVMRVQAREEGAFQQLVAQYDRRILYYIRRILGTDVDAADILQEIWIKVFLKITTLRTPEAFCVWLYKIAHDAAVSQLRKKKRRQTVDLTDELLCDARDTSDWHEFELLEHAEQVHAALGQLSLPHREVLTLRFLEELEVAEISEIVGCTVGTVKSRLHYAKTAMRRLLEANCRE